MADDVASIGVKMETDGVERGIKSLEALSQQGPKVEKAMAGVEGAAVRTGKSIKSLAEGSGKGLDEIGKAAPTASRNLGAVASSADDAKKSLAAMAASVSGFSQVNAAAVQMAGSLGSASAAARVNVSTMQGVEAAVNALNSAEKKYIQSLMDEARMMSMGQGDRAAYIAQTKGMGESAQALARALGNKTEEMQKARSAALGASDAMGLFKGAVAGAISLSSLKQLTEMADAMTNVNSRLKLVTSSSTELARVQADLFNVAQSSRTRFVDLADTYAQMARATKDLGVSQKDMLQVTQTISQAVTISGGSAASAQAALVQLSQGFASGALRGEELNSVLEQTPRLAQAIAQGLGVSTGELRKLGSEGELTAEKVLGALKKSAAQVQTDFDQMSVTVEQSLTRVSNSMLNLVGTVDKLTGASSGVAGVFSRFSTNLDALDGQIKTMTGTNSLSDFFFVAFNKEKDLNAELAVSQKELDALKTRLEMAPENIYLRSATADAQNFVNKLIEAKARLKDLNEGATGSNPADAYMSYPTMSQSYAKYAKQQADSEKALTEARMRAAGINQQYFKDLKTYQEALALGTISTEGYTKAVSELATKTYESSTAGKETAKQHKAGAAAAKVEENAYASLMASINAKIAANQEELLYGHKLSESDKLRIQLEAQLEAGKKKLTIAHQTAAKAALEELKSQEQIMAAAKRNVALYLEQAAAAQQWADDDVKRSKALETARQAMDAYETSAREEFDRLKLESSLIGKSNQQRAVALAQYDAEIELKRKLAEIDKMDAVNGESDREEMRVRERAVYAQKLASAQTKAYNDEWKQSFDQTSQALTDALMRGGKDAGEYLADYFRTLVLRPVIKAIVDPIAAPITTAVQSALGQGPGGANLLNTGKTLYDAFTSPGGMFQDFGGYLSNSAYEIGGKAFGAGLDSIGGAAYRVGDALAGAADTINLAGNVLSYGKALYDLSEGKFGSAAGTAIGTYFGGPIGAAIGSVLGGLADSLFAGDSGTPHMGAQANYQGGMVSRGSMPGEQWQESTYTAVSALALALGQALDGTAKAFGQTAGYSLSTTFADDSSSDGAFGGLSITGPDGKSLVDWSSFDKEWGGRWFSDGEAGYKEYLATMASDVKSALLAMDLPGWADQLLASSKDLDTLNTALQQIGTVKAVFDSLGHSMTMFADLSGSVQTTLLNVSGGIDALASNAQSFYANYFSEQERLDATVDSLTATFAKYGATLPATAEQYRTLVEQQMAAGDAGAEFAAVLLGLNGTFKTVADAWKTELDGMSKTVGDFFTGIKDNIASAMAEVAGSRKDILRGTATMTAAEIQAAIGNALVYSPSMAGVAGAQGATATAASAVAAAKAKADASAAQSAGRRGAVSAVQAEIDRMQKRRDDWNAYANQKTSEIASYWDGGSNSGYSYNKRKAWSNEAEANRSQAYEIIAQINADLAPKLQELERLKAIAAAAADVAASDAQRLAAAQAAQAAAQKAEVQAKTDYAAQMRKFVADAGTSVGKLSDLRGEVVDFYEAQAQAVQGMLQSAGNLRSVVDSVRLGQLTTAQTAAELGNRYALDYAMALSTTGSTRAGYVDAMAGNLQSLSEAMKAEAATSADWKVQTAKLLAQATNAAGMLEGDANTDDYKDVSLGLLDSIDKALESLNGMTKSAEQVIADAVNSGTASNLAGLRAIVAALQGQTVPAFASGGVHLGGLRIVGENGPELEATGPSRIWNQRQLAGALGGGGNSARVEQLLQQLIDEQRVQASRQVDLQLQLNKQIQRWDAMGMPEVREVSA